MAEDKNGHLLDQDGKLAHDPRCSFCGDAPEAWTAEEIAAVKAVLHAQPVVFDASDVTWDNDAECETRAPKFSAGFQFPDPDPLTVRFRRGEWPTTGTYTAGPFGEGS